MLPLVTVACAETPVGPREAGATFCGSTPIALEVGEVAVPNGGFSGGCRLAPVLGAEYVMSWVDLRALMAAEAGPEPTFEPYLVRIRYDADVPLLLRAAEDSAAQRSELAPTVAHGPVALEEEGPAQTRPRHRTTPLVLDEVFLLEDEFSGLPRPARVIRVYPNGLVVVRWDVEPQEGFDVFLAQLDTAWNFVGAYGIPAMRGALADAMPRSTGAGQMLALAQQEVEIPMRSRAEIANDSLFVWLELLAFPWVSATRMSMTLAHETAHLYQTMYMHDSRPLPGQETVTGASFWAVEGGANLFSYEMLRRMSAVAPDANHDWRAAPATTAVSLFQQRSQPGGGLLTGGYDAAMGFMRDLILRRMATGETHSEAIREVSRGALEGWYGYDGVANRRGLVSRMRARLGSRWSASTALLDWALSYAGDDLTPNPQYQDRASLRVWDLPPLFGFGWRPDAEMTREKPPQYFFKTYGSPGYARFHDDGGGMFLEVQAFEVPIAWKVLRIR